MRKISARIMNPLFSIWSYPSPRFEELSQKVFKMGKVNSSGFWILDFGSSEKMLDLLKCCLFVGGRFSQSPFCV